MHRLEANILHHAKKQREQRNTKDRGHGYKKSYNYEQEIKEQRKLKQRQKYLEFKYGTGNVNNTYPCDW